MHVSSNLERTRVGVTRGHAAQAPTPVDGYRLRSDALELSVWTYGATLVEALVPDRDGRRDNVVVRLPTLSDYEATEARAYLGATMGRYARCIAGGRTELDGRIVELTRDHGQGPHHIHGGRFGFDAFVWQVVDETCMPQRVAIRMRLRRPDGDEGYPGEIVAETTYAIEGGHTIVVEHEAVTDAPTLCDLTNHAMWNLAGRGTIDEHHLRVNADRVLPVDDELVPVGSPVAVDRAGLDLRAFTALSAVRLDHCFVLEDPSEAASLVDPRSGRRMTITTDRPGLQVYSGDQFQRRRAGICLQAGSWPNAPNRPDFPSVRLDPGATYRTRTAYRFDLGDDAPHAVLPR